MGKTVLPLIISVKSTDAPVELRAAFETAEPAENAKIADWAWRFNFTLADSFVIELKEKKSSKEIAKEILQRVLDKNAAGVVVAGIDYLRRANVLTDLQEQLNQRNLLLWDAGIGSEPLIEAMKA